MKRTYISILAGIGILMCFTGCSSKEKKSRSMTFEGPEKKTEVKIETTKKDPD